ncbi:MAG TPA: RHS repeat domain-containing protein [Candidatus Dormibacteraeota bacterium]|nr:RHS repeat domain-containing protein [Candidatus Dormibacteraeota bacterium]
MPLEMTTRHWTGRAWANRLTQITQGTSTVSFAYDNANRRTSLTLPNGVTMS